MTKGSWKWKEMEGNERNERKWKEMKGNEKKEKEMKGNEKKWKEMKRKLIKVPPHFKKSKLIISYY